jgi:signal transduction histidine kinase
VAKQSEYRQIPLVDFEKTISSREELSSQLADPLLLDSWFLQDVYAALVVDPEQNILLANSVFQLYTRLETGAIYNYSLTDFFPGIYQGTLGDAMMKGHLGIPSHNIDLIPGQFLPLEDQLISFNVIPLKDKDGNHIGLLLCFLARNNTTCIPGSGDCKTIINHVDSVFLLVNREMKIRAFNQYFRKEVRRYVSQEITIGTDITRLVPMDVGEDFIPFFNRALKGEKSCREYKIRGLWFEVSFNPVRVNDQIEAIVIFATNIDERVTAREELQALTNELLHSNRELQQFAYITSHNLRAPVVNLVSLLGFLERDNMASVLNLEILEKIEVSAHRLEKTLDELVKVVAIKDKKDSRLEKVNLQQVLNSLLESLEWQILETGALIKVDFSPVPEILYPRAYVFSIMQNLLTNSLKYVYPGRRPEIQIRSFCEKGHVGICIRDNGLGIDLEKHGERVFGLYQRFHEEKGLHGRGLGLYIVKAQVKALGGWIELKSIEGEGSEFRLFLRPVSK